MSYNSNSNNGQTSSTRGNLVKVSKSNPCPHCGKPDWCYSIGELSVCNRDNEPATGWEATSKKDADGHTFYARPQEKKPVRSAQTTYYLYPARDGSPLVRVKRIDFGDGRKKKFEQQHWDSAVNEWVSKLGNVQRASIPVYRYAEVQEAKARGELVAIVDGEGCADKLWEIGLAATTSIGGMGKWRLTDTMDLQDAKVAICPDRDIPGIEDAAKVSEHFPDAPWLHCYPDSKAWDNLPKSQGLDIKDWIESQNLTVTEVLAAVGERKVSRQELPLDTSSDEALPAPTENNALRSDDKLIQDYNKISAFFGDRIRLNKLSKRIEINGKPVSIDRAKIQLATKYGILARSGREDLQDILMELAHQNEYSPIEEYLLSLPQPKNTAILDSLAERYFGATLPIYQSFVRRTLISAVARALSPGCKVDTALILQGDQGFLKSTFFKILAGGIYFDDSVGAVSDKDERLKLHRAWVVEWSELETIFSRRDVSSTKAFLSCSVDALRPPYHRDTQDFPRASIIVGSTNKDEFLSDETGNRRFWVVPVKKKIDVDLLTQERDAIWAAAVLAYKSGENWWLTDEEDAFLAQANQSWQATDVWEAALLNHLQDKSACTISDLLTKIIGLELAKQNRGEQMRVSNILRRNGWTKVRKQIGNKREWFWEKVGQEVGQVLNPLPTSVLEESREKVGQEVGQVLNPLPTSVLEEAAQPAQPFLSNFSKNQENTTSTTHAAYLTDATLENCERFEVGGRAGWAAQNKTHETFMVQGLESAQPAAQPAAQPLIHKEVGQQEKQVTFRTGSRVWVKDAGSAYKGATGEIKDIFYSCTGETYLVKFDKLVKNIQQVEFEASDLMLLKN